MGIKLIILLLIAVHSLYAATYTYSICSTSTIENAKYCIKKYIKKPNADVFIIHDVDGKYKTTYGAFKTYDEAKLFQKKLSKTMLSQKPFIKKIEQDLPMSKRGELFEPIMVDILNIEHSIHPAKTILPQTDNTKKQENTVQTKFAVYKSKKDTHNKVEHNNSIPFKIETNKIEQKTDNISRNENIIHKVIDNNQSNTVQETFLPENIEKKSLSIGLDIAIAYTPMYLEGDIKYGNGTQMNFKEDLGFSKLKGTIIPKISFSHDTHHIYSSYFKNSYEGSTILEADSVLNNYTFTKNQTINSKMSTEWFQSGYRYKFLDSLIGFDIISTSNKLTVSNNLNSTEIESSYIIPTINIDMLQHFRDRFSLSYGGGIGKSNLVNYHEYYLALQMNGFSIKNILIDIGYMDKKLDINDELYKGDSQYSGSYVKLIKQF